MLPHTQYIGPALTDRQACEQALKDATDYDYEKVGDWNSQIIVSTSYPPHAKQDINSL